MSGCSREAGTGFQVVVSCCQKTKFLTTGTLKATRRLFVSNISVCVVCDVSVCVCVEGGLFLPRSKRRV